MKWIDVKERTPRKSGVYLVVSDNSVKLYGFNSKEEPYLAIPDKIKNFDIFFNIEKSGAIYMHYDVTHWMEFEEKIENEWEDVKIELPKENGIYLVMIEDDNTFMGRLRVMYFNYNDDNLSEKIENKFYMYKVISTDTVSTEECEPIWIPSVVDNVTHWMPVPELP